MTTALIIVLSAFLISMFIIFNLKKRNSIDNEGNEPITEQSKPKFPIVMVMLLIVFAAGLATYAVMPTIMSTT